MVWILVGFIVLFFLMMVYSCMVISGRASQCEDCVDRFECESNGHYKCYDRKPRDPNA